MRVLTYTNNTLTVIRDDLFFCKEYKKPSFISGSNFYYEPTIKQMDDKLLSVPLQTKALEYIETFDFPVQVKCVNSKGEYLGIKYIEDGETEVEEAPDKNILFPIYDFITLEWKHTVVVNQEGFFMHIGFCGDHYYAFMDTVNNELPIEIQKYDFATKSFSIYIPYYKNYLLNIQESVLINELNTILGRLAFGEQISWSIQEKEAFEYTQNTSALTPFVDTLLSSRNIHGETKEILISKILNKSESFKLLYASLLGNFHSKQKEIEEATTIEALKEISK